MGKSHLLRFWATVLLCLVIFAAAACWFDRRVTERVERNLASVQRLVATSAAGNITSYLSRVTETVRSILSFPPTWEGGVKPLVAERFRLLADIYPEISSAAYADREGWIYFTGQTRNFLPGGIRLEDVYEGQALLESLVRHTRDTAVRATVTDFMRFVPDIGRVFEAPVVLFSKSVVFDDNYVGTVLIPYQLDFFVDHFLRPLGVAGQMDLHLVSNKGLVVFSSVPELRFRTLPGGFASGPAGTFDKWAEDLGRASMPPHVETAGGFTSLFSVGVPGEAKGGHTGYFKPLTVAGTGWTVVASSPTTEATRIERTVLLPIFAGSAGLVLVVCGLAFGYFRRMGRTLHKVAIFQSAAEQSGDGLSIIDDCGRFVFANRAYLELAGYSLKELVGRDISMMRSHYEGPDVIAEVARTVTAGKVWKGQVSRRRRGDGQVFHVTQTTAPIRRDGRIIGFVTSQRDITEEARVLRELEDTAERLSAQTVELQEAKYDLERDIEARERAEREKEGLERRLRRAQTLEAVGQLAGGVAHDFNNLLGSILGCVYVLQIEGPQQGPVPEEVSRIRELCKRGGELTRQLLAVGRRAPTQTETVDLDGLLASVHLLLRRTLPKHVAFRWQVPSGLPSIHGNPSNLMTAFLNLTLNARDAMSTGGTLTVRARTAEAEVIIEVADSGCGIPGPLQDRVFEPFFTTKDPGQGTGLGLSSVYATVRECGGEIGLESTVGVGTVFTLRFPVQVENAAQPMEGGDDGPTEEHPRTPAWILMVEDEDHIAAMMVDVLERRGYRTVVVRDGTEALKVVRNRRADLGLVLLDLMLPELGGEEVYHLLKTLEPGLPVLFTTGREDLAESLDNTVRRLPKPFTDDELLAAVADVLPLAPDGR